MRRRRPGCARAVSLVQRAIGLCQDLGRQSAAHEPGADCRRSIRGGRVPVVSGDATAQLLQRVAGRRLRRWPGRGLLAGHRGAARQLASQRSGIRTRTPASGNEATGRDARRWTGSTRTTNESSPRRRGEPLPSILLRRPAIGRRAARRSFDTRNHFIPRGWTKSMRRSGSGPSDGRRPRRAGTRGCAGAAMDPGGAQRRRPREMLTRNLHSREIKVDAKLLERQAPLPQDPETCRRTRSAVNWTYSAVLVDLV